MKKRFAAVLLTIALLASGCISSNAGGGSGFDLGRFVRNPVIMVIIVALAIWFAFKSSGTKH